MDRGTGTDWRNDSQLPAIENIGQQVSSAVQGELSSGKGGSAMSGEVTLLTQAVARSIVRNIREGAFEWTAAEAAGISRATFYRWIERGDRGEAPFAVLAAQVRQASAQARLEAEQWVWKHDPLSWLRFGPGRERQNEPGWGDPVAALTEAHVGEQVEEDPTWSEALTEVLRQVEQQEQARSAKDVTEGTPESG
jgi:predicted DNA-binding transcriptional regulator AlpA